MRMTEAWLLFDEVALRAAAGNPNGKVSLALPTLGRLEALPDPKKVLRDLLVKASGLKGRHLRRFKSARAVQDLARLIDDYTPLLALPAFAAFDEEVRLALQRLLG